MILEVVEPHDHAACAAEALVELHEDLVVDRNYGIEPFDELNDHLQLILLELLDIVHRDGLLEDLGHAEV